MADRGAWAEEGGEARQNRRRRRKSSTMAKRARLGHVRICGWGWQGCRHRPRRYPFCAAPATRYRQTSILIRLLKLPEASSGHRLHFTTLQPTTDQTDEKRK